MTPTTRPALDPAPLAPLARAIAQTIADTPVRLGTPEGAADLSAALTVTIARFMGRELGPDARVLAEVAAERARQDAKWGEQNGHDWEFMSILTEEVGEVAKAANEANFESSPTRGDFSELRAELVQVAACAVLHIEAIDRRAALAAGAEGSAR